MGRSTIPEPGFEAERPQAASIATPRRRFLLIAILLSVGVHLVAALLIVLLPRALPPDKAPDEPVTVALLMVEKQGAGPVDAAGSAEPHPTPQNQAEAPKAEPPKPEPPQPGPPKPELPKPEPPKPATPAPKVVPAPLVTPHADETVLKPAEPPPPQPAPQPPQPASKLVKAEPVPPRPQEAPVFDLSGTDSESNAIAIGQGILPAIPDDRFRNKPPIYPIEAQIHDQHGSVVLLIHVSENGAAAGVDVQQSSGVDLLDQAAVAAVLKWHFRPAMEDGHAVPFDYPFRFIFEAK